MAHNDLKHSSSSEEETSGSEDEQTSGSDSDEVPFTDGLVEKPKQVNESVVARRQSANKPQAPDLSSSETEESGSDTDSDSTPKKSVIVDPNVKPISSIPMERVGGKLVSKPGKKDGSKTISTPPPVKSKRPSPAPTEIEKDAKKAKQNTANRETKKALVAVSQSANKAQAPDQSASETEESGSETDTDSDSTPKKSAVADPNIKPITSKPIEREGPNLESKSAKKSGSKTVSMPPPAKSKPPPAPKTNEKDAKKGKKTTATEDDSKKQLFQWLWSEDDEIVVLQGMIDYKNEKGQHAIANARLFHEFIEKALHVDVSRAQLVDKVRRLRRKYENNASREKDGKDRSFSKSHEQKAYELSKLLWGSYSNNSNNNISGTESKKKNQSQHNGKLKGTGTAASVLKSNGVDDEIVVLQGMIDYKNEKGQHAIADMRAFHEFIEKALHVDVSRAQLVDKVRRLMRKYGNNASREKDGKDKSFSKSHEQKAYELSKLLWGSYSNNSNNNISGTESKKKNQSQQNGKLKGTGTAASVLKSNGVVDKDKLMVEVEKKMDISLFVRYGEMSGCPILSEEIVKAGMELVDGSKRVQLEAKWKKLKEQELELYVKRMELLKEQAQVVLEAVRSSGN